MDSILVMFDHLALETNCFVVFVDETGHENLASGHTVYGLAGCGVLAQDLDHEVIRPWRRLCRRIGGGKEVPLHASSFTRSVTDRDKARVGNFFQFRRFARVGAVLSTNTKLPKDVKPIEIISSVFMNRIIDVARWTIFKSLVIIFEESQRANQLIFSAFASNVIKENGIALPLEFYFMPKKSAHPGLQVADFIAHAIHGHTISRAKGEAVFRKDFKSIFHGIDTKLCSFAEVSNVIRN